MNLSHSVIELALAGQVLLWLSVILSFVLTRQATLFHPLWFYLLFHGIVFVARPLLVHYFRFDTEWKYMGFEADDLQQIRALVASSFALIVLAISCVGLLGS